MVFKVGFVGLTHLGLISGAAALCKKNKVIFFDPDTHLIEALEKGDYPIKEPGFAEAIKENKKNAFFTSNKEDISTCDIVYVSPDIPTDDKGRSDLSGILKLIEDTAVCWPKKGSTVILSQVHPGFTRQVSKRLEKRGIDVSRLFYQVETLVFGIAMERALYPERYILGRANKNQVLCKKLVNYLESYNCSVLPMVYESAEFCKICINAFLASSVSTANTLEEICEKIGAKWKEIVPALRLDKRIGEYAYLKPGLGISGGNIERDLCSIINLSNKNGTEASSIEAYIRNSRYRKNWPLRVFYEEVMPKLLNIPKLGFLGVTYKENTHSIKNSPSIQLMSKLKNFDSFAYDPQVSVLPEALSTIFIADKEEEVINNAEVLFIMTPWPQFKKISERVFYEAKNLKFIVDPYSVLEHVQFRKDVGYLSFC